MVSNRHALSRFSHMDECALQGIGLVIQAQPPLDCETYIHRSGRTGRANKKGVCILFYTKRDQQLVKNIERQARITFERIGPPQNEDLVKAAAKSAKLMLQVRRSFHFCVAPKLCVC